MKKNKGITLVALVVTIIVLLILAAVSINFILGENGVITRAKEAKKNTELAKIKEEIDIKVLEEQSNNNGKIKDSTFINILKEYGEIEYDENEIKIIAIVTEQGDRIEINDITSGFFADEIAQRATQYYGMKVTGYDCECKGVNTWRIYYADNDNIYLIADDYITKNNAPRSANYSITENNKQGTLSFDNVYKDYPDGSKWLLGTHLDKKGNRVPNSKAIKWEKKFLDRNPENTNIAISSVAYLLDTNIWSIYAGENAEYAIGTPTLELLCASYKDTHPDEYIECEVLDDDGYKIRKNGETDYYYIIENFFTNDYNEIYSKFDKTLAHDLWIASPSPASNGTNWLYTVYDDQIFQNPHSDNYPGLRPVVCLKSDVRLQKQEDGTCKINT